MKQIGSGITGLQLLEQKPESAIGKQLGEIGSQAIMARLKENAKPPANPQEIQELLISLTVLQTKLRQISIGEKLSAHMTEKERTISLSILNRLRAKGEPAAIARIVARLMALYPLQGERPDSVVEDWVRKLQRFPLASIWVAYDRLIENPGRFAPSLGDFICQVKLHAKTTTHLIYQLEDI